jgi:hypothetical protein
MKFARLDLMDSHVERMTQKGSAMIAPQNIFGQSTLNETPFIMRHALVHRWKDAEFMYLGFHAWIALAPSSKSA